MCPLVWIRRYCARTGDGSGALVAKADRTTTSRDTLVLPRATFVSIECNKPVGCRAYPQWASVVTVHRELLQWARANASARRHRFSAKTAEAITPVTSMNAATFADAGLIAIVTWYNA